MTTARWKAVVFDLDDTLYPERQYVASGFAAVAAWIEIHLGIPEAETLAELTGYFEAGARGDTFNHWAARRRLAAEHLVPLMVETYRQHSPTVRPFPGVPDLLDRLHRCFQLGIVSDGCLEVQRRKLSALDVTRHFDAIVFSDQWGRQAWKPSTTPFEHVLSQLGVTGAQTVYVADNAAKDFAGARKLGMATVQACWGPNLYSSMLPPDPSYAPDSVAATLGDLELMLFRPKRPSP